MFDPGLTKLVVVGVVALLVLGPQRLLHVARIAGTLLGRAQRYVNEIRSAVARDIELDKLRQIGTEVVQAARQAGNTYSVIDGGVSKLADMSICAGVAHDVGLPGRQWRARQKYALSVHSMHGRVAWRRRVRLRSNAANAAYAIVAAAGGF